MKPKHVFGGGAVAGIIGTVALTASGSAGATGALNASSTTNPAGQVDPTTAVANAKQATMIQQSAASKVISKSSQTLKVNQSSTHKRTALGASIFVDYGNVQVKVIAQGKKIVDVQTVQYPHQDGQSIMIARYAVPQLRKQALVAQSAKIAGVSGASYTSYGFQKSLQSALKKLGI